MNTVHLQRLAVTIASGALAASAVSLAMAGGAGGPSTDTPTHALETNRPVEAVPATLSLTPPPLVAEPEPEPGPVRAAPVGDDAATPRAPRVKERARTDSGKKLEKDEKDEDDDKHETVKPRIRDDDDDDDEEKSDEEKVTEEQKGDTRERSSEDGETSSETDTRRSRTEER